MKRAMICIFIMLSGGIAAAHRGPYAVDTEVDQLVQIDPTYQFTTPIADLPFRVTTIEYSTDGFIYGVNPVADSLIKVDPLTGAVEIVGPLGIDLDFHADLDEDDQGQLWMLESEAGGLYTIDRTTGTATLQCQADFPYLTGLAIADGRWWTARLDWPNPPTDPGCGLEFLWDDWKYPLQMESAVDGWIYSQSVWYQGQYAHYTFSRYDPESGNSEALGDFVYWNWGGLTGITFNPYDQPTPTIPALDRHGVVLLIVLLAAAGGAILKRTTAA